MQKLTIIAGLVFVVISGTEGIGNSPLTNGWEAFKDFHGKTYASLVEEGRRKIIFLRNVADVVEHNSKYALGLVSYSKELNFFADLTPTEFNKRNGFKPPAPGKWIVDDSDLENGTALVNRTLPTSFDWRTTGKVSPVKDQGECGCCWSFSANGGMESQVLIKGATLQPLSEQQLVSCDTKGTNAGCNGGLFTTAWDYVIKVSKGVVSQSSYPYTSGGGTNSACKFGSNSKIVQTLTSYKIVASDDTSLVTALVNKGPVSVGIDATDMMLVSDDIYSCGTTPALDHAVLLVGYGVNPDGKKYWIIKNSWGTSWGQKGFFKLARGAGDCGVTQFPAYPIL